jgi:hypothetical protein
MIIIQVKVGVERALEEWPIATEAPEVDAQVRDGGRVGSTRTTGGWTTEASFTLDF